MKKWHLSLREQAIGCAALAVIAVLAIMVGITANRLTNQRAQIDNLSIEMTGLQRESENLSMCISQAYDISSIDTRARELGMTDPVESQLRVVRLPASSQETYSITVANTTEDTAQE